MYHFNHHQGQDEVPYWFPRGAHHYLAHTEQGYSIRALARAANCHASTVLRQVRRYEMLRDDPLIDEALTHWGNCYRPAISNTVATDKKDYTAMSAPQMSASFDMSEIPMSDDENRILTCLSDPNCVLAVAQDMEKAVVVKSHDDGSTSRLAIVDRGVAQTMAIKDWISAEKKGRITRYALTSAGRAAYKRGATPPSAAVVGFAEAQSTFGGQSLSVTPQPVSLDGGNLRRTITESPMASLARRRDKDGKPFLADALVAAGERLREDFEYAQMGPRVAKNWDQFLSGDSENADKDDGGYGPSAARTRVSGALKDLGPGLGDVVLRCCCFLEGMEVAEKRMGWSARSGKIVLRIALQRLQRHYEERYGKHGPLIG